jgi:hypothetical protein
MAKIQGTNVIAPIVPFDTTDVHPSHEARYGKGGYRTVATTAERNAITSARREAGMLVYVTDDETIYSLNADLTTWEPLGLGSTLPSGTEGYVLTYVNGSWTAAAPASSFDQSLNTTDAVEFSGVTLGSGSLTLANGSQVVAGSFDNMTGGGNGISLVCAVGYELNWQGGRLRNVQLGGDGSPVQIVSDSAIQWQADGDALTVQAAGITFADETQQTTAWLGSLSWNDLDDRPTIPAEYVLPATNATTLGGLIVGTGLSFFANGTVFVSYGSTSSTACVGNDARLSNSREWTASTVTQAEAEAGTATTRRAWTAERVFQAIAAWWAASASKTKLDGIATGATANATDAQLRDRSTHTGTQAISTVSGLQTALDGKQASGSYAAATHTHAISDVTSLQTTLDGKASTSHGHAISDVTGLQTALDGKQASGSYAASSHTHAVGDLTQSGATSNQVIAWNGTAWAPATVSGGSSAWSSITGTPTTLSGYGITDAVGSSDSRLTDSRTPTAHNQAWSTITSTPTTLSGYGISDAVGSSDSRLTDSRTPTSHTHGLADITQGGATTGQVIAWSGSAWAPATVSGGGGSTSASDLTSGTLADARLSDKARAAGNLYLWSNFR